MIGNLVAEAAADDAPNRVICMPLRA